MFGFLYKEKEITFSEFNQSEIFFNYKPEFRHKLDFLPTSTSKIR